MANKNSKVKENVAGKYYVDTGCMGCGVCVNIAPGIFEMNKDGSNAYVARQPKNKKEIDLCKEAIESCPASAIGDDGE